VLSLGKGIKGTLLVVKSKRYTKGKSRVMPRYNVELTCLGTLRAHVGVDAENEQAAKEVAIVTAKSGDAIWHYEGSDDNTVECTGCTEIH
jgi:hypothetical protein